MTPVYTDDILTGYEFKPLDDFYGDVVFTYTVADSNGPGTRTRLSLTVSPVQDLPRLGNLGESGLNLRSTPEDTPFVFTADDLLAGYADPDSGYTVPDVAPMTIKPGSVQSPYGDIVYNGVVDGKDTFTFTPFLNFSGSTQIDYVIVDDAQAEVATSKYINVTPVNDPPSVTLNREATT